MNITHERNETRTVLLASARSTYLVGPVSGLQLAAVLAAIVLPVFIAISRIPGWTFVIMLLWQIAAISCVRAHGRNGWQLLAGLWRSMQRDKTCNANYTPPSEPALITPTPIHIPAATPNNITNASVDTSTTTRAATGRARALFASAPGRIAKATSITTAHGDVFILPRPGGHNKPGRVSAAWHITGPGYALLPARDQENAIDAWSGAINRIAALPGIVGISVHERADTTTGLTQARTWHDNNADDASVPIAVAAYEELLATVDARDPSCVITVTFDPRTTPGAAARATTGDTSRRTMKGTRGKLEAIIALIEEVPPILRNAGLTLHQRLDAAEIVHAAMDLARPLGDKPAHVTQLPIAPVFPAYTESNDLTSVTSDTGTQVHHAALIATTATSVGVTGDVLTPLFTARSGVATALALTIRPLPAERTQARARARHVKLRRQRAAAENSSMTGLLIDTHRLDQEMMTLHALGADAARGSVETELIITVTITGDDPQQVRTAKAAIIRDGAPLRFTTITYPMPAIMFTRTPIGGLL